MRHFYYENYESFVVKSKFPLKIFPLNFLYFTRRQQFKRDMRETLKSRNLMHN